MILLFIKYIYFNVIKKFKSNLNKKIKNKKKLNGAGRVREIPILAPPHPV